MGCRFPQRGGWRRVTATAVALGATGVFAAPVTAGTSVQAVVVVAAVCQAQATIDFTPALGLVPAIVGPVGTNAMTYTMNGTATCTIGTPAWFQWQANGWVQPGANCAAYLTAASQPFMLASFGTPNADLTVAGLGPAEVLFFSQSEASPGMFTAAGPLVWQNPAQMLSCLQGGTASITLNGYLAVID